MSTISPVTLHPTTPMTHNLPSATDLRIGSQTNRLLGTFHLASTDSDDAPTTLHLALYAGERLGAAQGYAMLAAAKTDMYNLTGDETGAAAVLKQGNRYYGYEVNERNLDNGLRSRLTASTLSLQTGEAERLQLDVVSKDPALRALVENDDLQNTYR